MFHTCLPSIQLANSKRLLLSGSRDDKANPTPFKQRHSPVGEGEVHRGERQKQLDSVETYSNWGTGANSRLSVMLVSPLELAGGLRQLNYGGGVTKLSNLLSLKDHTVIPTRELSTATQSCGSSTTTPLLLDPARFGSAVAGEPLLVYYPQLSRCRRWLGGCGCGDVCCWCFGCAFAAAYIH